MDSEVNDETVCGREVDDVISALESTKSSIETLLNKVKSKEPLVSAERLFLKELLELVD